MVERREGDGARERGTVTPLAVVLVPRRAKQKLSYPGRALACVSLYQCISVDGGLAVCGGS